MKRQHLSERRSIPHWLLYGKWRDSSIWFAGVAVSGGWQSYPEVLFAFPGSQPKLGGWAGGGKAKKKRAQPTAIMYDRRASQRVNRRPAMAGWLVLVGMRQVGWVTRADTHTHAAGLTFGLWASSLSCMSWAKVCSRMLLSSACCRLSFMSSSVSSSGWRGTI